MGIRKRVKKLVLPLIGRQAPPEPGSAPPPRRPPVARPVYEEPASPRGDAEPTAWIRAQVEEHPLVLFMKGSPGQPQCGFSANAAGILASYGRPIHHVDVLLDPEVREAVKQFSSWPTIPQVYIGGEFVGGSDILAQLHASGELKGQLAGAFGEG